MTTLEPESSNFPCPLPPDTLIQRLAGGLALKERVRSSYLTLNIRGRRSLSDVQACLFRKHTLGRWPPKRIQVGCGTCRHLKAPAGLGLLPFPIPFSIGFEPLVKPNKIKSIDHHSQILADSPPAFRVVRACCSAGDPHGGAVATKAFARDH